MRHWVCIADKNLWLKFQGLTKIRKNLENLGYTVFHTCMAFRCTSKVIVLVLYHKVCTVTTFTEDQFNNLN